MMQSVFLAVDHGPESLETTSLGGGVLRLSLPGPGQGGKREEGVWVGAGMLTMSPSGLFWRDVKTALDSGKETFGIFLP